MRESSPLDARQSGLKFAYGSQKVRGVNLGGVSLRAATTFKRLHTKNLKVVCS
jgi:hypothetical protein